MGCVEWGDGRVGEVREKEGRGVGRGEGGVGIKRYDGQPRIR